MKEKVGCSDVLFATAHAFSWSLCVGVNSGVTVSWVVCYPVTLSEVHFRD